MELILRFFLIYQFCRYPEYYCIFFSSFELLQKTLFQKTGFSCSSFSCYQNHIPFTCTTYPLLNIIVRTYFAITNSLNSRRNIKEFSIVSKFSILYPSRPNTISLLKASLCSFKISPISS